MKRLLALLALTFVLSAQALTFVPSASADDVEPPSATSVAESRATEFRAVTGGQGEDVPGGGLLIAAYATVLVIVLGYVVYLGRLTAGTNRDLDRLQSAIDKKKPAEPAKDA
jgi:hypothetical protein